MDLGRGELPVDRGELITASKPAHGRRWVNWAHWIKTIATATSRPKKRAMDSIAGAQSAWSRALKVFMVLGGNYQPGPLRASPVG